MNVSWLGQSAIKIEYKYGGQDGLLLIDPYRLAGEELPRSFTPDIVMLTQGSDNLVTLSRDPFVIHEPGEYEKNGILIFSSATEADGEEKKIDGAPACIYRFEIEGVTLAHLGRLGRPLSDKELEAVENVDVLFVPVGGGEALDADKATEAVTRIEPRIVIPVCFKAEGTGKEFKPIDGFLKALGQNAVKPEPKAKITNKDLPAEELRIMVLEKQ